MSILCLNILKFVIIIGNSYRFFYFSDKQVIETRQPLNTKLSVYLGDPRKFLPTEFPILRDSLQRCLDLQQDQILTDEKDPCNVSNVSIQEIFSEVAMKLQHDGQVLTAS